jgi:hypothetical protein
VDGSRLILLIWTKEQSHEANHRAVKLSPPECRAGTGRDQASDSRSPWNQEAASPTETPTEPRGLESHFSGSESTLGEVEKEPLMSVTVRFKNDEVCPCPACWINPELTQRAWQAFRGKAVRLGRVITTIVPEHQCGSDTYWEVLDPGMVETAAEIFDENRECSVVCRHVLEMGD